MHHPAPPPCLGDPVFHDDPSASWRRENIESAADMARVIEAVAALMERMGYSGKEVFAARLALEEAIANAHKHGHSGDWGVPVVLRYRVSVEVMAAEVQDQGRGFDPARVADPLDRKYLDQPSGRGLLLMRAYMSYVCFNEQGNRVRMAKRRAEAPPAGTGA